MLAAISGTAVVSKQAVAAKSVDRTVVAATKPKAKAPAKKVAATVRGGWAQRMRGCAVLLWRRHARAQALTHSLQRCAEQKTKNKWVGNSDGFDASKFYGADRKLFLPVSLVAPCSTGVLSLLR